MMARVRRTGIAAALLGAAVMACRPAPGAFSVTKTQDRTVLSQALPAMNGRGLRVTVLEVTYGPGDRLDQRCLAPPGRAWQRAAPLFVRHRDGDLVWSQVAA